MRSPAVYTPQISPAGDQIASLRPVEGRGAIVVSPVGGGPSRALYRDADRSIDNVTWSRDGRWLLYFQDAGGNEAYHLYRLSPSGWPVGSPVVDLTPFKGVTAELVGMPARKPRLAVITINRRDPSLTDAFRVDLDSGKLELAAQNNGHMTGYFADGDGRVLLASAIEDTGATLVFARKDESSAWRLIYTAPLTERFNVRELHPDGAEAVVRTNRDGNNEELFWMSLADGKLRPVGPHRCGRFDAGEIILDDAGQELAQTCVELTPRIAPTAAVTTRAVAALAAGDKAVEFVSRSADAKRWIFYVNASNDPGRYVLYDDVSGKARVLFATRPWLDGKLLSVSQPYWIAARDGLPLLVYLTMPTAKVAEKPPLLVFIHGGPWARDTAEFSGQIQIWANRGYAVLQVNFRGSTGLGKSHYQGGVGQFGRAMVDDVLDGVDWAIRTKGISDRICVAGGSYGGYATLVALTRYPNRFACGVDFAGPVDLVTLVESFPPIWKPWLPRSWYRFVGNPGIPKERQAMAEQSPINSIDKARAPLMIFQGANDPRVTQAQSDAVAGAFCRTGLRVTYLLAGNEGHGFGNEETALGATRAAEVFLAHELGGRMQQTASPAVQQAVAQMTVKEPCLQH